MTTYTKSKSDYAEDELPQEQQIIQTSSLLRFTSFVHLIRESRKRYPTMGAVTGHPGMGKTVAIQAYLNSLAPRSHTGLPAAVKVKVKPRSTPKALALDIVAALEDTPRGRNIYEIADEAADALRRNDLELLIIDEADRLNEDGVRR